WAGLLDHAHDRVDCRIGIIAEPLLEGVDLGKDSLDPAFRHRGENPLAPTARIVGIGAGTAERGGPGPVTANEIIIAQRDQPRSFDGVMDCAALWREVFDPGVRRIDWGWRAVQWRQPPPLENIVIGFARKIAAMAKR